MAPHQVNCTLRNKTNILAFLRKTQIKYLYFYNPLKKNQINLLNYVIIKKHPWFQNDILKIYVIFS